MFTSDCDMDTVERPSSLSSLVEGRCLLRELNEAIPGKCSVVDSSFMCPRKLKCKINAKKGGIDGKIIERLR